MAYGRKMLFKFFTLFLCLLIIFGASVIVSILYPIKYKDYINKYAQRYNIDPFLVAAIINVESKYNKDAL
ncbi:MAG TPA: transglycosylase SLT domain-containing protein, partial [Tissierellaceae bacterium]|nr:transglycosylase SLT domain-containing protein [Tissierellaceae bacterium]